MISVVRLLYLTVLNNARYQEEATTGQDGKFRVRGLQVGMDTRLLHPQHLDGIWIGQDQYRMPLAPLSEYPEAWF